MLGDVMPVGVSSTLRFGAAALATMPWLIQDIRKDKDALVAAWLGFEVGLWNSIGYVSQAVGLDSTPASESAFICSLAVVIVPMLDFLAGKKLLPRQWTGALLAVIGVALLELVGGSASAGHSLSSDDLLTMVQPFAFGIGFRRMEQAMHKFPHHASRMTAAQLLAVFMASFGYGLWAIDIPTIQGFPWLEWMTDSSLLFSLFWTGIITTAMSIYMENKAMETLSAAETTLIFSTEPLWGAAFAGFVMHEELGPNVALGAVFILTACLYSNMGMVGFKNLWQGGIQSFGLGPGMALAKPIVNKAKPLQNQLAWFTSSAATSWAWWKVAASNIPSLDEASDLLEDIVGRFD
jgi:drug/metabolite transporter (DMT)-like permease